MRATNGSVHHRSKSDSVGRVFDVEGARQAGTEFVMDAVRLRRLRQSVVPMAHGRKRSGPIGSRP